VFLLDGYLGYPPPIAAALVDLTYHLNNSGEAVGKIGASQIADLRVNYRRYV
jgi:hypothetical protein